MERPLCLSRQQPETALGDMAIIGELEFFFGIATNLRLIVVEPSVRASAFFELQALIRLYQEALSRLTRRWPSEVNGINCGGLDANDLSSACMPCRAAIVPIAAITTVTGSTWSV
jgi:hypothetical protein